MASKGARMGSHLRSCVLVVLVAATALLPLAICPLWLPLLPPSLGGFWAARGLAVIGSIAALLAIGRGQDSKGRLSMVLASPAVTLPLLALVFYSLIPAVYVELYLGGPLAAPFWARAENLRYPTDQFLSYATNTTAESWILAFSGIGLLLATAFDRLIPVRRDEGSLSPPPFAWGLALICAAGLAFHVGKGLLSPMALPWVGSLVDTLPPLVMFGVALVLQSQGVHPVRRGIWIVVGLAAGAGLLFPYQIKAYVMLLVTLLLIAVLRSRGWVRVAIMVTVLAAPALGAGMVMAPRGTLPNLAGKIVWRQAETMFCMDFALRDAASGGGEWRSGPFYFAAGLVPRILWPDKPTLSHGDAYGKFCGVKIAGHSASITLLGEPALRGGPWGMATAAAILAGLSAVMVGVWKRGGQVGTAFAIGLAPWLVDFDQHFAMYIANVAKASLAILPVALLIGSYGAKGCAPGLKKFLGRNDQGHRSGRLPPGKGN